jgi:L-cysteine:1D-myo-inositol 2-amino-2-deoxy-alpha-D-glucopyranoside ligase
VPDALQLFDTARRAVVPFEPGRLVSIYVCGITPYDATHLGHAATYLTFDLIERRLRDRGHDTRLVRNITDVDDDLLRAARARGLHYLDLATAELATFDEDMAALGMLEPWREPRATGALADIRRIIGRLIDEGLAYATDGAVYFAAASAPGFGHLSGLDRAAMLAAGPTRGEDPHDPAKRDPLDAVLWRRSAPGEPSWESRWGPGRPGWHVECTALALRELGPTVDLHGGGTDLLYPHHECESAQAEAVTGVPFARHWLHQAMVGLDGEKMSKSRGNLVFVGDLRRRREPAAIRVALLAQHYRTPWEWHDDLLEGAAQRLARWRTGTARPGDAALAEVRAALDDDLDTAAALAAIDDAAASGHDVGAAAGLLGVVLGGA